MTADRPLAQLVKHEQRLKNKIFWLSALYILLTLLLILLNLFTWPVKTATELFHETVYQQKILDFVPPGYVKTLRVSEKVKLQKKEKKQ